MSTKRAMGFVNGAAAVCVAVCLGVGVAGAAEYEINGMTFTVPDGFVIEEVAGNGLAPRPITADFDEMGRLYVADSSGSNEAVEIQLEKKPHRIVRLEDTDGDGVFDESVVFADRMMFPEGTMWRDGSLYVSAPPSIWKLTDTDGDGVVDEREEWLHQTLTYCANDLHGPYAARDGMVYWAKGAFAEQSYERPDGGEWKTRASHIFRRSADGGIVEPMMVGGMDNPVDVVMTVGGERLFTSTFLQNPSGGKRDGIIHAIYGGTYGKIHDVIDDHPRTGDVMPVMTHMGPAAPAGMAIYESGGKGFGEGYRGNLFAVSFNMHKVTRHVLNPKGATFESVDEDFVVADSMDFHPTDVFEDADGSLLIVDTGGWYKLCCPTSQLHKPDVLGAIYRVRKIGAHEVDDARGLGIDWEGLDAAGLAGLLGDERWVVRDRAMARLAEMGEGALVVLAGVIEGGGAGAVHAVWTVARIEGEGARVVNRAALTSGDATVRQAALHAVALHRDRGAVGAILVNEMLRDESRAVRRVAAEALGRAGDSRAVGALLYAAGRVDDSDGADAARIMEHSIIYALIEIDDAERTAVWSRAEDSAVRRAAMIAVDQMPSGRLEPTEVAAMLESEDAVLRETSGWLIGRHGDWGGALAGYFEEQMAALGDDAAREEALAEQLIALTRDESIQRVVARAAEANEWGAAAQRVGLAVMTRAPLSVAPDSWVVTWMTLFSSDDEEILRKVTDAAIRTPASTAILGSFNEYLHRAANAKNRSDEMRFAAFVAMREQVRPLDDDAFSLITRRLSGEADGQTRIRAAGVLANAPLTDNQVMALCDVVAAAGPLEMPHLLRVFERVNPAATAIGLKLTDSLLKSPAFMTLRVEALRPIMDRFGPVVQGKAEDLYGMLDVGAERRRAELESLMASLPGGDVRRGQLVFNSTQAACTTCHAMGYLGGTLGPDLTTIGGVRTKMDLLESIVYPSASYVRSYEPVMVTTSSGQVLAGVLREDGAREVVVGIGPGQEMRVAREDVVSVQPGFVSVMPAGMNSVLTEQQLADLLEFLGNARWR